MTEKKRRIKGQRVTGREFVETADGLGLNTQEATRVWWRIIMRLKSLHGISFETALANYATYGQLFELRKLDECPFKGMTDEQWELLKKVAYEYTAELS